MFNFLIGVLVGGVIVVVFPKAYAWVKEKVDEAKSKL